MITKKENPKHKAAFLIALFESIAHPKIDCDKKFAAECVKRMINQIYKNIISFDLKKIDVSYWEQVEKEVKILSDGWISVDKLPEKNMKVYWLYEDNSKDIGFYYSEKKTFANFDNDGKLKITHWMPISKTNVAEIIEESKVNKISSKFLLADSCPTCGHSPCLCIVPLGNYR